MSRGRGEVGGQDQPAEPQPRCERLGRRPAVDDDVGGEALQRTDRVAVVAELGVVVVLDHDPVAAACPVDQRRAPLGREHRARRVLVRGGEEDRPGVEPLERGGVGAVSVDRERHGLEPGAGEGARQTRPARLLDGDAPDAAGREQAPQEREARPEAAGDQHLRGLCLQAAAARERLGHGVAQFRLAERVRVAEAPVGGRAQRAGHGARPRGPEGAVQRGQRGPQVVQRRPPRGGPVRGRLGQRHRQLADERPTAPAGEQVALGGELRVRLDHHAAGHPELDRERAGRGQTRARG